MGFLKFGDVPILPNSSIGRLCEDMNNILGHGVWYDTFQIPNTKWLWLVNDIVTTMKSDKVLCASFGLYPSYVAGILNSVKEIHFHTLCSEKLNYAHYIEKYIAGKECTFRLLTEYNFVCLQNPFSVNVCGETVTIWFEARQFPKLPSELIFAQSVLKTMRLSSLAYGIMCINKRVIYITN